MKIKSFSELHEHLPKKLIILLHKCIELEILITLEEVQRSGVGYHSHNRLLFKVGNNKIVTIDDFLFFFNGKFKKHIVTQVINNEIWKFCSFFEIMNDSASTLTKKKEIEMREEYLSLIHI